MSIIEHAGNETFIEHGTPGEEGHWRVLYIRWTDGTDGDPGVAVEEVLDALLERVARLIPPESLESAPERLLQMLYADKYGLDAGAADGDGATEPYPDFPQEYPTEVHLAAAAQDVEPAYEPAPALTHEQLQVFAAPTDPRA